MKELQERVQNMLAGETKRREVALKWVNQVAEIILPACEDIWGKGEQYHGVVLGVAQVTAIKNDKKKYSGIYLRYNEHYGKYNNECEYAGFYLQKDEDMAVWGTALDDLRGKEFWYAIQVIMEWIPQVVEIMDKREQSREQLMTRINID